MKVGETVRVTKTPPDLVPEVESVFQHCVGKTFVIKAVSDTGRLELDLSDTFQEPCYMQTIWIEPDCVEVL